MFVISFQYVKGDPYKNIGIEHAIFMFLFKD